MSLLSILIAITIIGIIVGMIVMDGGTTINDAKKARIRGDLETVMMASEKYYADIGSYPSGNVSTQNKDGEVCTKLLSTEKNEEGETKGPWLTRCPYSPLKDGSYSVSGTTPSTFDATHTSSDYTVNFKSLK